ncbi:MAG: aminomethyl-transferring glycine dehydrogenase [Phycisphaeraceae bacterium]
MTASPTTAAARLDSRNRDASTDPFTQRHLGSVGDTLAEMLEQIGVPSLDALIDEAVPEHIRLEQPLQLSDADAIDEQAALSRLRQIASKNRVVKSMIGMGYHGTHTPSVVRRNILENPLWYTPYTPYQAEIAQGRLEALLNFQTVVTDLTALPLAGASLLDEATAAGEAMAMCFAVARQKKKRFLVDQACHPQTLGVMSTRARTLGISLETVDLTQQAESGSVTIGEDVCGVLVQYPTTDGRVVDYAKVCERAHVDGAMVVAACDLLSLTLLTPPGEWGGGGADVAVGSSQRFGVPMGYGGPHAAFLATHEKHARKLPGRLVGVSKDSQGNRALRLAIQTREQHIKRDRATSNICTAQVLLAVIASMYAVHHGPEGLKKIALSVAGKAARLRGRLTAMGLSAGEHPMFDTVTISGVSSDDVIAAADTRNLNLRKLDDDRVSIACDETTTDEDLDLCVAAFEAATSKQADPDHAADAIALDEALPAEGDALRRTSDFLTNEVFHRYRAEHELLRYIASLQEKDISLADSMIPLGSCTMKLNAASEMLPVTWPEFANLHPYCPADQAEGYREMIEQLNRWLAEITGFSAVSMQPNSGAQGEYAGLLTIRAYHEANGEAHRNVCLVPTSAHGTNPASAVIAGMKVVPVQCDDRGDIDLGDLRNKAETNADHLAALMITYPSTHGVFEEGVTRACRIIHDHGGQVYMDGANMNAQVGLTSPGKVGADVCHLNLHKTFCIPHGGGGPGMGPIGVAEHLTPHVPGDPTRGDTNAVSAAPFGSPMILPISWMYIAMMGGAGLTDATRLAIANANYMARRLEDHYNILYTGSNGRVAHEFIVDCRGFEKSAHITVEDIAKRLIDFGYHAPTMSWPVPGTLMIEPTESESKVELDRFCDAMIAIRREIAEIEENKIAAEHSPLKHAPHPAAVVTSDDWPFQYTREQAAYPSDWQRQRKFWPPVARVDNAYGDRHLICTCPPMEDYCES